MAEQTARKVKNTTPLCIRISNAAYAILRGRVATRQGLGREVDRLIFEDDVRQKVYQELAGVQHD